MSIQAFLVSPEVTAHPVTLPDGSVEEFHFRKVSGADFRRYQIAYASPDENAQALAIQNLIAACLCDADGKPVLTKEQAGGLTMEGINSLFPVVLEINGRGKANDAGKS